MDNRRQGKRQRERERQTLPRTTNARTRAHAYIERGGGPACRGLTSPSFIEEEQDFVMGFFCCWWSSRDPKICLLPGQVPKA